MAQPDSNLRWSKIQLCLFEPSVRELFKWRNLTQIRLKMIGSHSINVNYVRNRKSFFLQQQVTFLVPHAMSERIRHRHLRYMRVDTRETNVDQTNDDICRLNWLEFLRIDRCMGGDQNIILFWLGTDQHYLDLRIG